MDPADRRPADQGKGEVSRTRDAREDAGNGGGPTILLGEKIVGDNSPMVSGGAFLNTTRPDAVLGDIRCHVASRAV